MNKVDSKEGISILA